MAHPVERETVFVVLHAFGYGLALDHDTSNRLMLHLVWKPMSVL